MKWKQLTGYQVKDNLKSLAIFYAIYYGMMVVISVINSVLHATSSLDGAVNYSLNSNGTEMVGVVFIFVVGLCSFKERFYLCLQSGISRKTLFVSFLFASGITVAIMGLADLLLPALINWVFQDTHMISFFEQSYALAFESKGVLFFLNQWGFSFSLYWVMMLAGYFISILYYRMSTPVKMAVSVGVPVLCIYILPVLDYTMFQYKLFSSLSQFVVFALGIDSYPQIRAWMPVVSFLVVTAVLSGFAFLLMRKAVLKKS